MMLDRIIIFVAVLTFLLFPFNAYAFDQNGPPVASLNEGELKIGLEYSYSELDIDATTPKISSALSDEVFKDPILNTAYFHFAYGLLDYLELIVRLGGGYIDINGNEKDIIGYNLLDDSGPNFVFGVGLKWTIYNTDKIKYGALFSFSAVDFDDFSTVNGIYNGSPVTFDPEIKLMETQIGMGIDYHLLENFSFYGGPLLHFSRGDVDLTFETWDIEEDSMFGGYLGFNYVIGNHLLDINTSSTGGGWGVGVLWRYGFD